MFSKVYKISRFYVVIFFFTNEFFCKIKIFISDWFIVYNLKIFNFNAYFFQVACLNNLTTYGYIRFYF